MARGSGRNRSIAAAILAAHLALAGPAVSCAFHTVLPERTAIDRVLESDHLVLARPDPENPFAFRVTETLIDGKREVVLTDLVDSYTRRALASDPEDTVLFGYDAETAEWRRIAYISPAYRAVVERVLAERDGWVQPYDPARFEIFEALQIHPDPALRNLALREIDKAPYDVLRGIDLQIPVEELLAGMGNIQAYSYIPIRALLLGLSGDDAARAKLRSYVDTVAGWNRGTDHLGAFAAGLIEIDGTDGVNQLERQILSAPGQPLDKLEQVVEALAIHNGGGTPGMRAAIAGALDRMIGARPETAPLVARQFGGRQDWSQAARLAPLVEGRGLRSAVEMLPVAIYVAQAKGAGAIQPSGGQGG